jgi:hypothetical protein
VYWESLVISASERETLSSVSVLHGVAPNKLLELKCTESSSEGGIVFKMAEVRVLGFQKYWTDKKKR